MKKGAAALGVLMISIMVSACSNDDPSLGPFFTVGGVVSGLTGTVVLQNNGGDDLTVTANGAFAFAAKLGPGEPYSVSVAADPEFQTCIVSNGTGTVLISDITTVSLDCHMRGGLDPAFHAPDGFVVHDNAAGGGADDAGKGVAVDPQGRVLVAGSSMNAAGNRDLAVWRFSANGALDTAFSGDGIVVHDGAAGGAGDDIGSAIAVDLQGRALVTGSSTSVNTDMTVWRFTANGTLDPSFNGSGIVTSNGAAGGSGDDAGNAITVDPQGRVLVAGSSTNAAGNRDLAVWRFNANGTLDTSFSGDGIATSNGAAGGTGDDIGNAIVVDSQGRVLVAGSSANAAGNKDLAVWRFTAAGALDTAFSGDGIVISAGAAGGTGDDSGNAIVVDSQGRVLVAGSSTNAAGNKDLAVWRFSSTGSLDPTFNSTGTVINNGAAGSSGDDIGHGLALDPGERILVAGSSMNASGNTDMVVWRLNANGSIDVSFASNGIAVHGGTAGGSGDDAGHSLTGDTAGRILVTGSSANAAGNSDLAVWRLLP